MASTTPTIWKSSSKVNSIDATVDGNDQYHSQTIALAGGGFLVVWEDNTKTLTGFEPNDIGGQRYDALGKKVGTEFLVSSNYADLSQQAVAVTALANGGFLAAYQTTDATGVIGANDGENIDVSIFKSDGSFDHDDDYRQGRGGAAPSPIDEIGRAHV